MKLVSPAIKKEEVKKEEVKMPIPKQVRKTAAEQLMNALVQTKSSSVDAKKLLMTSKACEYIFKYVRINGRTEVTEATLIFTASRDGWTMYDFHRLCDYRGPTLCLVQADTDYMCAGFTSIAWRSPEIWDVVEDASACVFALTDTLQVYKTKNPKKAVYHSRDTGPIW